MTKPFNVREIKDLPAEPGEQLYTIEQLNGEPAPTFVSPKTGVELGKLKVFRADAVERTLITFVEDGGYPMLRISSGGQSQDLVLNLEQIKLLLSQMVLWITR